MSKAESVQQSSKIKDNLLSEKAIIIATGAFNPPNFLHLRAFEAAKSFILHKFQLHASEGIISPFGGGASTLHNTQLICSTHRLQMCQLAVKDSNWIRVNNWQSTRHFKEDTKVVSRLLELLKHFQQFYLNREGAAIKIRIFLICGWPLIEQIVQQYTGQDPLKKSFKFPIDLSDRSVLNESLVKEPELELKELLEKFDLLVFWSSSYQVNNIKPTLHPLLAQYKHNIHLIEQEEDACSQLLSSSRLRGDCVKYCLPDSVIAYIQAHDLYHCYLQAEMFKSRFKNSKSSINSLKCKNNSLTFEPSTSSTPTEHEEDNNDIWKPNFKPRTNLHSTKSYSKSQNLLNYSSDYDNLTLDEILETSKGWDNYFNGSGQGSAQSTSTLQDSAQPENIVSDDEKPWKHCNDDEDLRKGDSVSDKTTGSGVGSNWKCKSGQQTSVWQQRYKDTDTPAVVLTYRRYRLVADPETTV
uniref:Cytidyltransferase-like domain-containing protein n=1 Tax=Ditylenchus dipsaci TaxID=166011 RepID=A0A915EDA6_9BILA